MKKIIFCALALACALWLYSCRDKEQVTCSECKGAKPIPGYLYLKIGQQTVSTDFEYWDAGKYQLALKKLPSSQYNEIFSYLQKTCPQVESSRYSMILYLNRGLNGNDTLTENDISGISFYMIRDQKMFHLLYQLEAGTFVKNDDLSCEVKCVYSNHVSYILQNCMPGEHKSWLMLYEPMEREPQLLRPKDKLSLKLKKFSEKQKEQPPDEDCLLPCVDDGEEPCHLSPVYGSTCNGEDEKPCLDQDVMNKLLFSGLLGKETIMDAFQLDLHYFFRDHFLGKSEKGKKYIWQYYYISDFLSNEELSPDILFNTCLCVIKANIMIKKLMNPDEYSDDILIDDDMKQELINLMIAYRNISADKDYCELIDNLILEIEMVSGKTVTEVWKEFNA